MVQVEAPAAAAAVAAVAQELQPGGDIYHGGGGHGSGGGGQLHQLVCLPKVRGRFPLTPLQHCLFVCLPLSYSGNPGVNDESELTGVSTGNARAIYLSCRGATFGGWRRRCWVVTQRCWSRVRSGRSCPMWS